MIVIGKKKTHLEYIADVRSVTSNIEVIGQYMGASTKIKHRCNICGHEWEVKPIYVLSGQGCPECAKLQRAQSKTKTHEQFVAEVAAINQNIEVIGQYIHANKKIEIKCKVCGNECSIRAADILRGHGCPKCSYKALTKTHEQYVAELADVNSDIAVIDKYLNSYTKIKHLCLRCGHEWCAKPHSILHGNHCPRCSTRRKSHEQYISEIATKNPNIEVVGEYINANTNIMHRCLVCGYEWLVRPNHILHGLGCPSCLETSGEQQVKQWLIANDIKYEYQKRFSDCKNERMLPFDFYLPNYNCCIEFDGAQHFREVNLWGGQEYLSQRQHNDQIKNDYCKENNIRLIRIKYDEDVSKVLNNAFGLVMLNKSL